MKSIFRGVLISAWFSSLLFGKSVFALEVQIEEGVKTCSLIQSATDRLDCYDKLSRQLISATKPANAPEHTINTPQVVSSAQASVVSTTRDIAKQEASIIPPDELGAGRRGVGSPKEKEPESYLVKVNKCTRNKADKKYRFFLEGGQVWRQLSDRRMFFKDCEFLAYITKDLLGHKLKVEDTGKEFRVARVK